MSYEAKGEFDVSTITLCCREALLEGVVLLDVLVAVFNSGKKKLLIMYYIVHKLNAMYP